MTSNEEETYKALEDAFDRDLEETVTKLGNGNGNGRSHYEKQQNEWSYQELLQRYEHLKDVTIENMPEVWSGLEFALSVKTTLNMNGNTLPFPGILLGPSSGSKIIIVEVFKGNRHVYYLDSFTPKSFVSHNSSVPKDKLKEVDLLPRLKNKLFLVSELAPIFSARDDELLQVMGILTRVVDGQGYQNHTGAQGHRGYDENIMFSWIGASVDIPPKVHRILGTLGPKLYFFRLPREEEDEDYYFDLKNENFEEKKQKIKTALHEYLTYFDMNPEAVFEDVDTDTNTELPKIALEKNKDEELAYRIVIRVARLLARLRAIVPTWETRDTQGSDYAYGLAKIENPKRAITQLGNLARGHALSKGRKYITMDDIPLIIHTALSTASTERVRVFELLIANKGKLSTNQICEFLNTTRPTALRTMTELKATGLVSMSGDSVEYNAPREITLNQSYSWFLSDEFKELKDICKEKYPPRHDIEEITTITDGSGRARGGGNSLHRTDNVIEDSSKTLEYPPKCYHCNINGFHTKDQYEEHGVRMHKNLPLYPGPADLEKLGLTPQNMSWEQQLPRDQYFGFELDPSFKDAKS